MFLVEPGARYVETLLAIWQAGGIAVPLSPLHAAPELAHVVEDAAPLVLVASAGARAARWPACRRRRVQTGCAPRMLASFPADGGRCPCRTRPRTR